MSPEFLMRLRTAKQELGQDHWRSHAAIARLIGWVVAVAVLASLPNTKDASCAGPDLPSWFPVRAVHSFDENWTVSMQTELRLRDDIFEISQFAYKPALNYHFNPGLGHLRRIQVHRQVPRGE